MTLKQKLSHLLRRKEYLGMSGQASVHGCNRGSIQIFREAVFGVDPNAFHPVERPLGNRSVLVADFNFDTTEWSGGQIRA